MITIGMLHNRKHPSSVKKAYAYAAAAKMEGVNFFYFSFSRVDFHTKTINGYTYNDGKWEESRFPFPDIIYNAGSAIKGDQYEVENKLRKYIPFTSHSIGNKLRVYKRINDGKEFSQYLIPTKKLTSIHTLREMIKRFKKVVVKPVSGRKGERVLFLEKLHPDEYRLIDKKKVVSLSQLKLKQFIRELLMTNKWLIQPYIHSVTKDGFPYDFRLHVQKNSEGEWAITSIYPRVTVKGIVSNISSGGYTNIVGDFLRMEFDEDYYNMQRYLERFALVFAKHFDGLYDEPLDELGIDVGIDENRKAWIYEVNWRPGTPPTYSLELDVARNHVGYAKYLLDQKGEQNLKY
jgi:hypothetical protein